MSEYFVVDNRIFVREHSSPVPLFRFKPHSNPRLTAQSWSIREGRTAGAPDILQLGVGDGPRVDLTREWQLFIAALNPGLSPQKVSAVLGDAVAFTNQTGFGGDDPYQNWLLGDNLNSRYPDGSPMLPQFDKVRTCAYACHTGVRVGDELYLTILDGNLTPPDINIVNPVTHPWLFFYATIVWVNSNGLEVKRGPFTQSAPAWGHPYNVTVMPLVSKYPIRVPLSMVEPVAGYTLPFFNYP